MANGHKRRPPKPVIAAVVLLALATAGYFWWKSVQPAATDALTASGAVESTEYQVASAMAGRVATVTVQEGDEVASGDVLVTLDATILQLQVDQAAQGVRVAEAAVTNARESGTDADVVAAEARLEQARILQRIAETQLNYAQVTAPHDGVIVAVVTNVGQNASPGKTLLTLTDPQDLFVRVFVAETRVGDVKVGQGVSIVTDSSGETFAGKVVFIASQSEFTPNNVETKDQRVKLVYEVRVQVADETGTLKPGMPVDVTFE